MKPSDIDERGQPLPKPQTPRIPKAIYRKQDKQNDSLAVLCLPSLPVPDLDLRYRLNRLRNMQMVDGITVDPNVMGGKPCIRGTRVTVGTIVGQLGSGVTRERLLEMYPYLTSGQIDDCLRFAAWRSQEEEIVFVEKSA